MPIYNFRCCIWVFGNHAGSTLYCCLQNSQLQLPQGGEQCREKLLGCCIWCCSHVLHHVHRRCVNSSQPFVQTLDSQTSPVSPECTQQWIKSLVRLSNQPRHVPTFHGQVHSSALVLFRVTNFASGCLQLVGTCRTVHIHLNSVYHSTVCYFSDQSTAGDTHTFTLSHLHVHSGKDLVEKCGHHGWEPCFRSCRLVKNRVLFHQTFFFWTYESLPIIFCGCCFSQVWWWLQWQPSVIQSKTCLSIVKHPTRKRNKKHSYPADSPSVNPTPCPDPKIMLNPAFTVNPKGAMSDLTSPTTRAGARVSLCRQTDTASTARFCQSCKAVVPFQFRSMNQVTDQPGLCSMVLSSKMFLPAQKENECVKRCQVFKCQDLKCQVSQTCAQMLHCRL